MPDTIQMFYLVSLVVGLIAFILGCFLIAIGRHRVMVAEHAASYLLSHPMRRVQVWQRDDLGYDDDDDLSRLAPVPPVRPTPPLPLSPKPPKARTTPKLGRERGAP